MFGGFGGIAAVLLVCALTACGGGGGGDGGGGGGGGSNPLQYSGNTSAAVITTGNAATLVASAVGGGTDVAAATSSIAPLGNLAGSQGQVDIGRRLIRAVRITVTRPDDSPRLTDVAVDQTDPCPDGGAVRVFGDVSGGGTGTLNVAYTNCRVAGDAMTGQATMRIDSFNNTLGIPLDYTITFGRLSLRGTTNGDIGGTVRVQSNLGANSETVTENVVVQFLSNGRMTKSENLVFIDVYNDLFSPSSYTESMSGRVFDSVHGFVDIITNTPLVFSTVTQLFPGSGELQLTGGSNRRIRATAGSATVVDLVLDLDSNGSFEIRARLLWSGLSEAMGTDLSDTDGDGMHNSWETAFGLNPSVDDRAGDADSDGFNNLAEYQAGTNPNVADATLPPPPNPGPLPPGPVTGLQVVLANNTDIVYDSGTGRIYAAVKAAVSGSPGSVVPINPATGALGTPIPVGIDPVKLARSDDGQYLYVGLEGQSAVQRINIASQAVDLTINLGNGQFNGPLYAEDIHVLPGTPQSFAVSLRNKCCSPRHEGVAIYDGNVRRTTTTPGHTGANRIEFSASASTLYGYNNETTEFGFRRMAVNATGVTVTDNYTSFDTPILISGFGTDIHFGGGFVFSTEGKMIDPISRTVVRTFTLPSMFGNFVVSEPSLNRVFYLTSGTIRAFDTGSGVEVGNATVSGTTGTVGNLIRWGMKGLAFRTSDGQIFMVESTSWIP